VLTIYIKYYFGKFLITILWSFQCVIKMHSIPKCDCYAHKAIMGVNLSPWSSKRYVLKEWCNQEEVVM
jgi:hypothetical protein